mmetsp:Transcript_8121/g.22011  ORF Transcript_8121/g.22011 Transcript_8121/m.22011 type:complete len:332 (-) Transcript_8121:122-1117(-)
MILSMLDKFAFVGSALRRIQAVLSFDGWHEYPHFATKKGLGRVGLLGCLLGIFLGIHFTIFVLLSFHRQLGFSQQLDISSGGDGNGSDNVISFWNAQRLDLLWKWSMYVCLLCIFHLLEFFTTVLYNAPDVASADAYLINHSTTYTFAALFSWTEFGLRFLFLFPNIQSSAISIIGLIIALIAQLVRSLAMITCGASFNHLIQKSRKNNHLLVTHGIYSVLRHPSYFGFYFWSIGMQMILNNPIAGCLSALASTIFFARRIPYEEESLLCHFEDEYVEYAKRTIIGIPFVPSNTVTNVGMGFSMATDSVAVSGSTNGDESSNSDAKCNKMD